jgi:rhodanese-related sulfurtransferase
LSDVIQLERKHTLMTSNIPSRRTSPARRLTDAGVVTRAIPYDQRPGARRQLQAKRALAALLVGGAMWVAFTAFAVAGEPAATPAQAASSPAAADATFVATPISQEALLEHQSKHPAHLFVLDVRTPQEYADGHVPGAVNVPHDQLASRLAEVPKDKDVVLYCKSGRRAGMAADVLAANGYTRLSHLEGDMNAWVEKGRPIAKP